MFNSQRFLKNKSIKKVSPKSRRTAELYKSSHNIGNRTAAERVGSYKETEVALVYPEGFWEAVKLEDGNVSPIETVLSRSRSRSPKSSPRSPPYYNELSPTRSGRRFMYSPVALPLKSKGQNSESSNSEAEDGSDSGEDSDSQSSMKGTKVTFKGSEPKRSSSRNSRASNRDCSEESGNGRKGPRQGSKSPSQGRASSSSGGAERKVYKRSPSQNARPSSRTPRIKRTACLNAAAIVGLLYEHDEPAHKKRKVEEEVEMETEDGETEEEEVTTTDTDDMYDSQFDRDLKRALAASLEEAKKASKKASDKEKDKKTNKKDDSPKEKEKKHKRDKSKELTKEKPKEGNKVKVKDGKKKEKSSVEKKVSKPSKKDSKEVKVKKEPKDKDKKLKKMKKDKDKDKKVKKDKKDKGKKEVDKKEKKEKSKDKDTKLKSKKEKDTVKKVVSKKVKKDKKDKDKDKKKKDKKKGKEKKSKRSVKEKPTDKEDKESEDGYSEESTDEEKEADVPLWPPPKRMASLNAAAILAASKEPFRKIVVDRSARTVHYNRKTVSKQEYKKPKSDLYRGLKRETGRWVEGMGTKEIETSKDYDPYAFHDSPVEVSEIERNTPSPEIQVLAIDSPAAPPVEKTPSIPPAIPVPPPAPSPDVQIIEVSVASPGPVQPPRTYQAHPGPLSPRPHPLPPAPPVSSYPPHHPGHQATYHGPPPPPPSISHPGMSSSSHSHSPSRMSSSGSIQPYPGPHPSQIPASHHYRSQRVQPLPAHHPQSQHPYYHHQSSSQQSHSKPFMPPHSARHHHMPPHVPHHPLPPPRPPTSSHPPHPSQQQPSPHYGPLPHPPPPLPHHHPQHAGYPVPPTRASPQAPPSTPPQGPQPPPPPPPPPPAHQSHPLPPHPPHPPKMYEDTMVDRLTPSQTPPVAQGSYQGSGHGYAHQSSPMGNTCSYPYPHSSGGGGSGAAGAAGPGGPQSNHCQGFPFGSMGSVSSYHMMACHSRPFGSAFTVPSFNTFGYYPADGLVDTMGETCCMPLSYHIQQQHVKVLVHNTALPPYPTGPNPYHHHSSHNTTPSITPLPDHPGELNSAESKEAKHSSRALVPINYSQGESAPMISADNPMASQSRIASYSSYYAEQGHHAPYKPGHIARAHEQYSYKLETQSVPPQPHYDSHQPPRGYEVQPAVIHPYGYHQPIHQPIPNPVVYQHPPPPPPNLSPRQRDDITQKEEKVEVPPHDDQPTSTHPSQFSINSQVSQAETKVEMTSPKAQIIPECHGEKKQTEGNDCKAERCPSPDATPTDGSPDGGSLTTATSVTTAATTATCATAAIALPPPPPAKPAPHALVPDHKGGEGGGQSPVVDKNENTNLESPAEEGVQKNAKRNKNCAINETGDINHKHYDKNNKKFDSKSQSEKVIPKYDIPSDIQTNNGTTDNVVRDPPSSEPPTPNGCFCVKKRSPKGSKIGVKNGTNKTSDGKCAKNKKKATSKRIGKTRTPQKSSGKGSGVNKTTAKKINSIFKCTKAKPKTSKSPSKTKNSNNSPKKRILKQNQKSPTKVKPGLLKKVKSVAKSINSKKSSASKQKQPKIGEILKKKPDSSKDSPKKNPKTISPKQQKAETSNKSRKTPLLTTTPPEVKVEPCSPNNLQIKQEVEEPKPSPCPKQRRMETPSPKFTNISRTNSPKLKRESPKSTNISRTNSPKLKRESDSPRSAPSPKIRREDNTRLTPSPKTKRDDRPISPKQRRTEGSPRSSPSPKLKDQPPILPSNKVLRVHVEALNPKSLSPKLRETSASPKSKELLGNGAAGKARREGSVSPKTPNKREKEEKKVMLGPRKMVPVMRTQPAHSGWKWEGKPLSKVHINHQSDNPVSVTRMCYPAIRHDDGDVIQVRDCVLVRSGPRRKDIPYVAKIGEFWEEPETGEMMMDVIWYYRPEQAESDRLPRHVPAEVFASKHKDRASIACIDDKCFVLTLNEFCRYKSHQKQLEMGYIPYTMLVPQLEQPPPVRQRIPRLNADPETVFVCRRVYDFKLKRILKNPAAN